MGLYITVMVTIYSHKLLYQPALFCSDIKYDYLFTKVKMKQCLLGISRLNRVDRLPDCWKLEVD